MLQLQSTTCRQLINFFFCDVCKDEKQKKVTLSLYLSEKRTKQKNQKKKREVQNQHEQHKALSYLSVRNFFNNTFVSIYYSLQFLYKMYTLIRSLQFLKAFTKYDVVPFSLFKSVPNIFCQNNSLLNHEGMYFWSKSCTKTRIRHNDKKKLLNISCVE